MKIIDDIPRHLTLDDYKEASIHFEALCIRAGLPKENIGYFGSISFPGISDIDAAVVGNAAQLKKLDELFIEEQTKPGEFAHMFCHRPVYLLDKALPFINNLHTLNGLDDRIGILIKNTGSPHAAPEHKLLNIVWFTFLLQTISQIQRAKTVSLRSLLLLYKNIEYSNTVFSGMSSTNKAPSCIKSCDLRKSIWERTYDMDQLVNSFDCLFTDTLVKFDNYCERLSPVRSGKAQTTRPVIVDKSFTVIPARVSKLEHARTVSILYVNDYAYHLAKDFFIKTSYCNLISQYMSCLRNAHSMYVSAGLPNPFVTPFQIQLKGVTGLMKIGLNRLLSVAPFGKAFIYSQCKTAL